LIVSVRLTSNRLSVAAAFRELERAGVGGIAVFAGRVRPDRRSGSRVVALDYETHEGPAMDGLRALERTARTRFGLAGAVLWHRVGRVRVGEVSVIVGAASGHRAPAFRAARFLIDRLKETVPIWKTERAGGATRRSRRSGRQSRPLAR
jgi:molybdopterin synthase catalytic subunit